MGEMHQCRVELCGRCDCTKWLQVQVGPGPHSSQDWWQGIKKGDDTDLSERTSQHSEVTPHLMSVLNENLLGHCEDDLISLWLQRLHLSCCLRGDKRIIHTQLLSDVPKLTCITVPVSGCLVG